jgi:hypothetical protein
MKKIKLMILLLTVITSAFAQDCFWAKRAGGSNNEVGQDLATDPSGNVYAVGTFEGASVTFGSTTLTAGSYFLVKYNAAGTLQWAKGPTGSGSARNGSYGVATDNSGNIYVTGAYNGTLTFGAFTLTASGYEDIFIAKYDASGNVAWAVSAGGSTGGEYPYGITADGSGNLFVTGRFTGTSIMIGSTTLTNYSPGINPDMFVAKYDNSGNALWAKSAGGNRYETGYSVAADGSGNCYVTGTFNSDSVAFGAYKVYNNAPAGYVAFVTKYNSSGTEQWAESIQDGADYKYDIVFSGGGVYVGGAYHDSPASFGTDTLTSIGSSNDIFLAKYDSNGNAQWARSGGGSQDEYFMSLTADASGNIYSTGIFKGASIAFGSTTITNHGSPASNDVFITAYNAGGVLQSAQSIGSTADEAAFGIAAGLPGNIYFTGKYNSPTSIGSVALSWSGQDDFFVADMYSFSSGIASFTNVTCNGANDGTATTTVTGGNAPYTYSWSTSPVQTTPNAVNLPAGTFSVVITEGYGCSQTSTVNITQPPADSAMICMVTVDSLSQNNVIIWDKTSFTTVDTFIIYREITTGNFLPIGEVPFDSLSQFTDTVRTLYFPNTGDPNVGTYRYKIAAKSSCGSTGPMSPYHNTIYIANTAGTFTWPQLYTIEGAPNPVIGYVLMRDDNSTGNWNAVGSVAGTQVFITDPQYSTYQATASWRVETQWAISCTPTRSFTTSVSNTYTNTGTSVRDRSLESSVSIFPNPSDGIFTIAFSSSAKGQQVAMEVMNVLGEKILSMQSGFEKQTLDLRDQPAGVYSAVFKTEKSVFVKKIVVK